MVLMNVKRLVPLLLTALLAVGCAPSSSDKPSVVTSTYAFEYAASRVAGDYAEVIDVLPRGSDAHGLELTGKQTAAIADADVIVHLPGFQPQMDDAVTQSSHDHVVDPSQFLTMRHPGSSEAADDSYADPHVWLDPSNVAAIGTHIAELLGEVDPDHRDAYSANAKALSSDMAALDAEFADGLTQCTIDSFIVNHAAFGYLADKYHLKQVGIVGLSTEQEPSPARIAQIQQTAQELGVTTIFYEQAVSSKMADAIANDLGLSTDVLDPLETISDQSRGEDYPAVMRSNLEALRKANECR